MQAQWQSYNPVHIHFGRGCRNLLIERLSGRHCLVVTSRRGHRQICDDAILGVFANQPQIKWLDNVCSNPDIEHLQSDIDDLVDSRFDAIVGFGGGSALDSAKALAIALSFKRENISLSELLNNGVLHQDVKPLPLFAVPTTAGTGSEVTPFATIWDHQQKKKLSLAGPQVFPHTAIIDPALSLGLPLDIMLSTGLDAINQAAESIWNKNATPVTIAYATRALQLGLEALPELVADQQNHDRCTQMAECSLFAGMAISQTRTALCHSISYPLTAHFDVPHGLACAFTMPEVLRLNLQVDDGRFRLLKRALGVLSLQQTFDDLNERLEVVRRVKSYVGEIAGLHLVINEMVTPGRADNCLAEVNVDIIREILDAAWSSA
jgi:alcohol dehydrogenase